MRAQKLRTEEDLAWEVDISIGDWRRSTRGKIWGGMVLEQLT